MITNLGFHHLPDADHEPVATFQALDDVLFVLDSNGNILSCKAGDLVSLKLRPWRMVKRNLQDLIPVEVKEQFERAFQELKLGRKVVTFEYRLLSPSAGCLWYEARLVSTLDYHQVLFIQNVTGQRPYSQRDLSLSYDKTIAAWSRALHLRDHETEDHTRRVTEMTLRLARRIGIQNSDLIHLRRGATLHDVGKLAIPDEILFKAGSLDEGEWEIMRRHPVMAEEILKSIFYLAPALNIPRSHHERWDGSGYPDGLAGDNIPLSARIFALVDVYDALTSDRPYRPAWPHAAAFEYIRQQAGHYFDPRIVPVFFSIFDE
jgi:HD-GYP domain-containing protein (c-di-GMP phosphodiesterase class II)